jgi:hypothetical protein
MCNYPFIKMYVDAACKLTLLTVTERDISLANECVTFLHDFTSYCYGITY